VKLLFTILLFISFKLEAQPYVANWTGWGHNSYQVQQGRDSINWITIGTVAGQLDAKTYQFTIPGPNYYYRIKADQDTTCAILVAEVLSIKNTPAKGKNKKLIQNLSVKIMVGSQIHYQIESPEPEQMQYSLYDIMGRKIRSRMINLHAGQNDFFDQKPATGIYYGSFEGYFNHLTVKFINQ
jgi:hypothetical protein